MICDMMIILAIIYILTALFYLFYSWLDLRQRQREFKKFKERVDEELGRYLEELMDEDSESGSSDRDGGAR